MPKLSREGLRNALASYDAARRSGTLGAATRDDAAPSPRERSPRRPRGEPERGTVRMFDPARGFGFVAPDAGGADVFVHARSLAMSGIETLRPGDRIEFVAVPDRRGAQAHEPHLLPNRSSPDDPR
jgi:cold shock protein